MKQNPHFLKDNFILMATRYPADMCNTNGRKILIYICDNIKSCVIECKNLTSTFEGLVIEHCFNFKKMVADLLLQSSQKKYKGSYTGTLELRIPKYSKIEQINIVLQRDYNVVVNETNMQELCQSYFIKNMVKKTTCFKNLAILDLIVISKPGIFAMLKYMKQAYQIFINQL